MSARPLPPFAWHGLPCWRVLDTDFLDGRHFFQSWLRWRAEPQAPRQLHYVAFCRTPPAPADWWSPSEADKHAELAALRQALAGQWFGLTAGFHRLLLDQGRLALTLCVGRAADLLKQQQFQADALLIHDEHPGALAADPVCWSFKALSACCQRGTVIHFMSGAERSRLEPLVRPSGIRLTADTAAPAKDAEQGSAAGGWIDAVFDPPWQHSRHAAPAAKAADSRRCVVVGAGLAGASTAAALARRGWQVSVLDQADHPASGASGLPVGLMVPHVSRDDCTLSRLSRAGVRLMLQQARALLVSGLDWAPSGVFERQIDGAPRLPDAWDAAARDWCLPDQLLADPGDQTPLPGIGHPQGAWIKPARLVQAWLNQPGIRVQLGRRVDALRQNQGVWELLDAQGAVLASAPRVILANAGGAPLLLQQLRAQAPCSPEWADSLDRVPATHGMRGLLSWASQPVDAPFPALPVNGAGAIIANIAHTGGTAWYMGSSYQPDTEAEREDRLNHLGNWQHLQQLVPALAAQLAPAFENGQMRAWKGSRCISVDRLPLVGPVSPDASLWLCAAMGSRGLSLSMLCAELLAAQWAGEPLPIEARLARSLIATRARRRA